MLDSFSFGAVLGALARERLGGRCEPFFALSQSTGKTGTVIKDLIANSLGCVVTGAGVEARPFFLPTAQAVTMIKDALGKVETRFGPPAVCFGEGSAWRQGRDSHCLHGAWRQRRDSHCLHCVGDGSSRRQGRDSHSLHRVGDGSAWRQGRDSHCLEDEVRAR